MPATKQSKTKARPPSRRKAPATPSLAKHPRLPEPIAKPDVFTVVLRGRQQRAADGRLFSEPDPATAIAQALDCRDYALPEPLLSWKGKSLAAILDVDFHGRQKPAPQQLEQAVRRLPIQPIFWWVSHGGGLKLIVIAAGDLSAEELAELVSHLLEKELTNAGLTGTEIKADTRHPAYSRDEERCSEVYRGAPADLETATRKLFYEYTDDDFDPAAWEDYLEERGQFVGARLEHTECPICPAPKKDKPLQVGERGYYCFSCSGNGLCFPGATSPGWIPARCLIDGTPIRPRSPLLLAVKNFTHFEQAAFLFPGVPEKRARVRYGAMLKLKHVIGADDPDFAEKRIAQCFLEYGLLRIGGIWCGRDGSPKTRGLDTLLSTLPAAQYRTEKGKANTDKRKWALLQSGGDLSHLGYPSMIPIRGVDLAAIPRMFQDAMRDSARERVLAILPPDPPINLRSDVSEGELQDAFKTVQGDFPGLFPNYLSLLIAAKGVAQLSLGADVPKTVVYGPTGAGKTQTARLAAYLTGERPGSLPMTENAERTQRAYGTASRDSSYAISDDFEKVAKRLPPGQLLSYVLGFDTGATYHEMYVGPIPVEFPAIPVLTCITIPDAMYSQPEIGRRFVAVDVGPGSDDTSVDWRATSGGGVESWLAVDPLGTHRAARDVIVSWVRNRYFNSDRIWTFREIAQDLGFRMLGDEPEADGADYLKFYEAWRDHAAWDGSSRWGEPGFRVFKLSEQAPLALLFRSLTDYGRDTARLKAVRWAAITKQPKLKIAIRPDPLNSDRIGVRFYVYQREQKGI